MKHTCSTGSQVPSIHRIVLSLCLLAAGCGFESLLAPPPEHFLIPLVDRLVFMLPLPKGAVNASISFRTRRPAGVEIPDFTEHSVMAWANEGGTIFDGSLTRGEIGPPVKDGFTWRWSGALAWPERAGYDKLGLLLERGGFYSAFSGPPLGNAYCTELPGAGVTDCGVDWATAALQELFNCHDVAGADVECLGTGYMLLPQISTFGFGQQRLVPTLHVSDDVAMSDASEAPIEERATMFYAIPFVQIFQAEDGWRYRSLQNYVRVTDDSPSIGPFPTPEAAAYAAVPDLGLTDGYWADMLVQYANTRTAVGRAAAGLLVALEPQQGERAQIAKQLAAELPHKP